MSVRMCAFGDVGEGKTMSIVKEALRFHLQNPNLPIFSNIALLTLPYKRIDSAAVLFEINEPCFVLLDELWHLADSRRGMSVVNDVMNMLLLRSRKKGWRVGYTEQWYTQTDIRIRFITQLFIQPSLLRRGGQLILREDIFDKFGSPLKVRAYDATGFFDDFLTGDDPFTLNLEELKFLWHKYRRDRGLVH